MLKKRKEKKNQELVLDHVAAPVLSAPSVRVATSQKERERGAVTENDGEVGPAGTTI